MLTMSDQRRVQSLHPNSASKRFVFPPSSLLLGLILCAGSIAGCTAEPTPTQDIYPTTIASCLPHSVFTTEDMRARVDCHPNEYKLEIDEDTVVLFAFPDSLLDWVGPIFVIHVPSVSEVVLSTDGSIFIEDYKSSEGRIAIEGVLNNPQLMSSINGRAKEIKGKGPYVLPTPTKRLSAVGRCAPEVVLGLASAI